MLLLFIIFMAYKFIEFKETIATIFSLYSIYFVPIKDSMDNLCIPLMEPLKGITSFDLLVSNTLTNQEESFSWIEEYLISKRPPKPTVETRSF